MTYVVTDNCIKCKYTDCVKVCPVDCFHEGEDMLVIDPEVCIDCGVCVAECPVDAILPENEELQDWVEFNHKYSKKWPVITEVKPAPPDAEKWKNVPNKKAKFYPED